MGFVEVKLTYLFRFDASTQIGLGHAYRCLALIEYLALHRATQCLIIVKQLPEYLHHKLAEFSATVVTLNDSEDELTAIEQLSKQYCSQLLILDGYQFDQHYRRSLAEMGLKIICFDDTNSFEKLYCDGLINALPFASALGYQHTAPNASLLLGLQYSILREEFMGSYQPPFMQRTKLLINFGGSDPAHLTLPIIQLLLSCPQVIKPEDLLVITGGAYLQQDKVSHLCQQAGVEHIHHCQNMAEQLSKCKMAICAPGSMVYELSYCAVPTIFLTIADNQLLSAQAHQKIGWCKVLDGLTKNSVALAIEQLMALWDDPKALLTMSTIAKSINDGQGVARIIAKIEEMIL